MSEATERARRALYKDATGPRGTDGGPSGGIVAAWRMVVNLTHALHAALDAIETLENGTARRDERPACKHDQGWGIRWSGGRYCLGCGLPEGVLKSREASDA